MMGLIRRALKFAAGGVAGAAVGSAVALLFAPESGNDLQRSLRDRLLRAKLAGVDAQAARANELIRKFRVEVNDPEALRDAEVKAREERTEAVTALGLGLNAPGAIASQEIVPNRPAKP